MPRREAKHVSRFIVTGGARERVRKYFNPDGFDPKSFRDMLMMGLLGLLLGELVVYYLLQQSADVGELPHNITDAVIIGISLLEFLVGPVVCWLGSSRRRSTMVGWTAAALTCMVTLFALPDPEITVDSGLCQVAVTPRSFPAGISVNTAVRLAMLIICGVVCALGRAAIFAHGLAYLDEHNPSDNLLMHVGIFIIHRVLVYILGSCMKTMTLHRPWLQILIIVIHYLITLLRLFRYAEVAPVAEIRKCSRHRGLFRSVARVFGSGVAVLQILALALLAAAWWGFATNESAYIQVKFHVLHNIDSEIGMATVNLRMIPVVLGVILAGFLYTAPVMPTFEKKSALGNAGKFTFLAALTYTLMTAWLSCHRGGIGGLGDLTYNQPACGQNCGCDRPWMTYTPVCAPEQMRTYFSPCHAGCATSETVNSVSVYSNCSCAPGGRVIIGPCDDGSCSSMYALHTMFTVVVATASTLAFVYQTSLILESTDKRDIAVAVGLTSVVVSLFAFVGAQGFYMGISSLTCAFTRGSKCLLQNNQFVPWVGYSSVVLAGLSLLFTICTYFLLRRQKEPREEDVCL